MFQHIDCFNAHWHSGDDFCISLVRHAGTGRIFLEIESGDQVAYVPTTLDPAEVDTWAETGAWDVLAAQTETGR